MKNLISFVMLSIFVYLISWSAAYTWIVGFDFKHYFEYMRLSWTHPGEIPAFLQISSIIMTILIMLFVYWIVKRNRLTG